MQPEWVFETGTRVAGGTALDVAARSTIAPAELGAIDLAPMGHEFGGIASVHSLSVEVRQPNGSWVAIPVASSAVTTEVLISDFPEATWHYTDPNHPIAAARTIRGISGTARHGPSQPARPDRRSLTGEDAEQSGEAHDHQQTDRGLRAAQFAQQQTQSLRFATQLPERLGRLHGEDNTGERKIQLRHVDPPAARSPDR